MTRKSGSLWPQQGRLLSCQITEAFLRSLEDEKPCRRQPGKPLLLCDATAAMASLSSSLMAKGS